MMPTFRTLPWAVVTCAASLLTPGSRTGGGKPFSTAIGHAKCLLFLAENDITRSKGGANHVPLNPCAAGRLRVRRARPADGVEHRPAGKSAVEIGPCPSAVR